MANYFFIPLYFQEIRGFSILLTGLALLPQTGLAVISSYLSSRVVSKIGPKLPMVFGLALSALGFLGMLTANFHSPHYLYLILPLAAIGFGCPFTMTGLQLPAFVL